ncbi:sushi, von Willebrand factor type A, EGF and pentraxin domain-containing protein 1-like [Ruditapes philippinarum]|uniref:sushi, von Willebrand factor type A, EGF and pentraxin domain-containing protein 1-like n=1 Tax=Ruditapes philippinarum TaxID=129788 RepID=UPI00295B4EB1|nr:sushi, von Willebrand factor type A, EGF and pentraxin domain-containing protein 1-like [Ruditapes philippinarum]
MDNRLLVTFIILYHTGSLLARSVIEPRKTSSQISNWIVFIGIKNDACAGVQLSNEWILTLGECVNSKKLSKLKVAFPNGKKSKVLTEERSPVGDDLLVLLKVEADKGVTDKFTDLASSSVPKNYVFELYNFNAKGAISGYDVKFVQSKVCTKDDRLGSTFKKKQHTCMKADVNRKNLCVPGFPVFGTKKKSTILQGLSTTGDKFCDSEVQSTVTISKHKDWIESVIYDCGSPPKIENGKVSLDKKSQTSIGATASVKCESGYEAKESTITCEFPGEWQSAMCEPIDCGQLPSITNGTATLDVPSTSTFGATASVDCTTGYEASKSTISCKENGKWNKATCTIKDCGPLSLITNGTATLDVPSTSTFGATASINCTAGYEASKTSISCKGNGKWTKSSCIIKDCGPLPTINNGTATLDDSGTSTFGATASINCMGGYETISASISCNQNGEWTNATCTIKDCGVLPSITNGTATLDEASISTFGATASVSCSSGYKADKKSISCKENGKWSKATCKIKNCGSPPSISNGVVTLDDASLTEFGATASVNCSANYAADKLSISCQANGKWDKATCTLNGCGSNVTVPNGNVTISSTTFGSVANISCDSGYDANKVSIECLKNGLWEKPTCTIKDCGSNITVTNGNVSFSSTTFGSVANVSCDNGHDVDKGSIRCLASGSWEKQTCTIKDCGSNITVTNGNVSYTSTTFGSVANVSCDNGHDVSKASVRCLASGNWEKPTCTIKGTAL